MLKLHTWNVRSPCTLWIGIRPPRHVCHAIVALLVSVQSLAAQESPVQSGDRVRATTISGPIVGTMLRFGDEVLLLSSPAHIVPRFAAAPLAGGSTAGEARIVRLTS